MFKKLVVFFFYNKVDSIIIFVDNCYCFYMFAFQEKEIYFLIAVLNVRCSKRIKKTVM